MPLLSDEERLGAERACKDSSGYANLLACAAVRLFMASPGRAWEPLAEGIAVVVQHRRMKSLVFRVLTFGSFDVVFEYEAHVGMRYVQETDTFHSFDLGDRVAAFGFAAADEARKVAKQVRDFLPSELPEDDAAPPAAAVAMAAPGKKVGACRSHAVGGAAAEPPRAIRVQSSRRRSFFGMFKVRRSGSPGYACRRP